MADIKRISVADRNTLRSTVNSYAAQGFSTIHSDINSTTLSRKKPFNWLLAIIMLFIPIIGWIALVAMLRASGRGSQVVEIMIGDAA
jgi:hypothetical protein